MEIKKEDLVMFKTFEDKFYVAFRPSILDQVPEVIPEKVIEVVIEEIEEVKKPTPEELEAIIKAEKIEELKAKLKELEV